MNKTIINLTQDAYINDNGNTYTAQAADKNGNTYTVCWDVLDSIDIDTLEDESEACDWENPSTVTDENGDDCTKTVTLQ